VKQVAVKQSGDDGRFDETVLNSSSTRVLATLNKGVCTMAMPMMKLTDEERNTPYHQMTALEGVYCRSNGDD
jgi:hypothetical protein